jgi:leucyl-tRNA synthetase
MYIGGPEHACMHLIYARFVMMALKDFGYVSHSEPFKKLVHQGLITNKGAKMSKSKNNVVSPDSFVEKYGSDVFRMYLMFMGPFEGGGDWSDTGIKGIVRFVDRLWKTIGVNTKFIQDSALVQAALHRTVKKVTEDIGILHFNTAISSLMELLNTIEREGGCSKDTARTVVLLIAPLAPHLGEELWSGLGGTSFVIDQHWPAYDPALLVEEKITIVIQVNGKVRGTIHVSKDVGKDEVLKLAKANENVQKYIAVGIKKEIYVAGKLVSLVV